VILGYLLSERVAFCTTGYRQRARSGDARDRLQTTVIVVERAEDRIVKALYFDSETGVPSTIRSRARCTSICRTGMFWPDRSVSDNGGQPVPGERLC